MGKWARQGAARRWVAAFACLVALTGGAADMPMLRWLDDDKARGNLTNVVMKIQREDKALSH